MPFNGERNLGVCVIQRLNRREVNVSVRLLGGDELSAEEKQNLTRFKTTWSPEHVPYSLGTGVRAQPDPARSREKFFYTAWNKSFPPPSIYEDPPFKSKTLTRKLPFAQVLGFALLAARHVGFVAALQLSSHWEIRSYKVDSK